MKVRAWPVRSSPACANDWRAKVLAIFARRWAARSERCGFLTIAPPGRGHDADWPASMQWQRQLQRCRTGVAPVSIFTKPERCDRRGEPVPEGHSSGRFFKIEIGATRVLLDCHASVQPPQLDVLEPARAAVILQADVAFARMVLVGDVELVLAAIGPSVRLRELVHVHVCDVLAVQRDIN